jgi:hypothetical protein
MPRYLAHVGALLGPRHVPRLWLGHWCRPGRSTAVAALVMQPRYLPARASPCDGVVSNRLGRGAGFGIDHLPGFIGIGLRGIGLPFFAITLSSSYPAHPLRRTHAPMGPPA